MSKYDHKKIEKKWQEIWDREGVNNAENDSPKKKEYILTEFPYPSGEGLHVGHLRPYVAFDVLARKRRAEGKNVLYPMGWDAFGLPTENYAIKTGKDPRLVTKENTDNFRRQFKMLGLSFDWSREINTTDPAYYKWTQWIFLQLYKQGLAYKAKTLINWCPKDKIGLANEEVVNDRCERCGTRVEKREKEQWMLAITKYARRLYDDLDTVNYIEQAKIQQRNWIGPSEGAEINFAVPETNENILIFTTRPDTIFGATYVVIAPEHPLVEKLLRSAKNPTEIKRYVENSRHLSEIERAAESRKKTGVNVEGIFALNPGNKESIPIFIADYVLAEYGTGAVMGVPAHDYRDYEFATQFNLTIREVIEPLIIQTQGEDAVRPDLPFVERQEVVCVIKHWSENKYLGIRWKKTNWQGFVIGGIEQGEDSISAGIREIKEETGFKNILFEKSLGTTVNSRFYQTVKTENRYARFHPVLFKLQNDEQDIVTDNEKALHDMAWLTTEEMAQFLSHTDMSIIWGRAVGQQCYTGSGLLVNSGKWDGLASETVKNKIIESVDGKLVTTFKLRDWVFSRQRYWGEPIPMIWCDGCKWQPVPEDQLPVILPEVEKYKPTETGESPLSNITDWVNTTCPNCQGSAKRETDVMPNWAGSSWYYLRYTDPNNDKEFASMKCLTYWTPVDWYNGGMEHTTLHLLYSRFWHKVLYDLKFVPTNEPYLKRTSHGLILAEGGEKMSKSKGNVINPDDIVKQFGADSLRLYEMFLGPFDQTVTWNSDGIVGVRRFIERSWRFIENKNEKDEPLPPATQTLLDQSVKKITEDIDSLKMNTAVSQLMILVKQLETARVSKQVLEIYIKLLSPFAPHVGQELWEHIGNKGIVWDSGWPPINDKPTILTEKIAIQINGKTRLVIEQSTGLSKDQLIATAMAHPSISKWLVSNGKIKTVFVPGRIINFIVNRSLDRKMNP